MGYIIYTPDAERGPTAYTQLQFDTIKEVARWAMDMVLAAPAPVPVSVPAPTSDPSPAPAQAPVSASTKCSPWVSSSLTSDIDSIEVTTWEPTPEIQVTPSLVAPEVDDDIDDTTLSNILKDVPDDNPFRELIESRDWGDLAQKFDIMVRDHFFGTLRKYEEYVCGDMESIMTSFIGQARKFAPYISRVLGIATPFNWNLLPNKFHNAAVNEEEYVKAYGFTPVTVIAPLSKEYASIWKFFSDAKRHVSWKDVNIEFKGIKWGDAKRLTEAVVSEWWSTTMPSDDLREFMIKCVTVIIYSKGININNTVKARNLFTEVVSELDKIGLPSDFVRWAGIGIGYKQCRAALVALGIEQTRHSDAVKYIGLRRVHDGSYMFENSLESYSELNGAPYVGVPESTEENIVTSRLRLLQTHPDSSRNTTIKGTPMSATDDDSYRAAMIRSTTYVYNPSDLLPLAVES